MNSSVKISERLRQTALSATLRELDSLAAMWSELVGPESVTKTTLTYRDDRSIDVEGSLEDALRDLDFRAPKALHMRVGYFKSEGRFSLVARRGVGSTLVFIEGSNQSWVDDARERTEARLRKLRPWWHWMRYTLFSTLVAGVLALLLVLAGNYAGLFDTGNEGWALFTVVLASVIGHGICWAFIPGLHLGESVPLGKIWKRAALALAGILVGAIISAAISEGIRLLFS